jgi:hypothetical protein
MSGPTPSKQWWRRPYSDKWRSWDTAVTIGIVLLLASLPIWLAWPWWVLWLAPLVFVALLYVWITVLFRLAGLDLNTGAVRDRGAQI